MGQTLGYGGNQQAASLAHSVPYMMDPQTGETIFRNPNSVDALVERMQGDGNSIYSLFYNSAQKHPQNKCFGTKTLIQEGQEGVPPVYEYQWLTYQTAMHQVTNLAGNMLDQNLFSESEDPTTGLKVKMAGICSINRKEWLQTDLATNSVGITSVPLYETLGVDMLNLILEQSELTTIFGSRKNLLTILNFIENSQNTIYLRKFVCFDEDLEDLPAHAQQQDIQVISFRDLVKNKPETDAYKQAQAEVSGKDIFTISYTSGTTDSSKGVVITNYNFIGALSNIRQVGVEFTIVPEDSYISYLPLAHVFDRLGVYSTLSVGAAVGFFGGDLLKIPEDLQLLRPTIFASVPRLLNKVFDRIQKTLENGSYMKQYMFAQGIAAKSSALDHDGSITNQFYDNLVFSKAKQRLGGNIRIMITASAPIAPNILKFLKVVFCCPIVEAYGQTESCGASFATRIYDNKTGHVGGPAIGIEFKLSDEPDMGYTRYTEPWPTGEVCIRGPSITKGYFKNEKLTRETIDNQGWLHTGDIAELGPGNGIRIIDRKKNIFKLSQGEYIVSEKLERAYEQSPYIGQVFITGDSLKNNIVAIVSPDFESLRSYLVNQGNQHSSSVSNEELIAMPPIVALIEKELQQQATKFRLNSLEQIRKCFRLIPEEFEVGKVLTPTMKLMREKARKVYVAEIEEMYAQAR